MITLLMHAVRCVALRAGNTKLHKGGHLCTGKDDVDDENDLAGSSPDGDAGSSPTARNPMAAR